MASPSSTLKKIGVCLTSVLLLLIIVLFAALPLARLEVPDDLMPPDVEPTLAIDQVHLVTMNDRQVHRDRQLLIRNGVIEAIRASGSPVSEDYRLIDGEGAYLLPGLFDMHVHAMDRKYLALSLAYGVTSVRNMGGFPMHLRWKQELADGRWLGSNLFSATPTLNGKENADPFGHKVVTDPDKARKLVRHYNRQGWDFIKVYANLDIAVYEAIIDEASSLNFPVAGHVPYEVVAGDYRLAAPMATIEHVEEIFQGPLNFEYDDDAVLAIAKKLKAMNATVTPTLMIFDHLTQIARNKQAVLDQLPLEYLNPLTRIFVERTSVARWLSASEDVQHRLDKQNSYFRYITRVLYDNGVNLVLGSDNGVIYAIPGISTHEEIALLQQAGLPASEILEMATINAARALFIEDRFGSIEVGKVADLIMTQHDPMIDLNHLRAPLAVIKNGQWLDQLALQQLRESAKNPSSAYLTLGRILEFVMSE